VQTLISLFTGDVFN